MALTFFWRCEGSNLTSPYDYSAGDTTSNLINSAVLEYNSGRNGSRSLKKPSGAAGGATFSPASIFPGSVVTPTDTVGCMGCWVKQTTLYNGGSGTSGFPRFRNLASTHFIYITGCDGQDSRNYGALISGAGGQVHLQCSGNVLTAGDWFFVILRWDVPNDKIRLEVYNESLTLVDSAEDLTTDLSTRCPSDIDIFSTGSWASAAGDMYFDTFMVANDYNEPLQDYANYNSYTQVAYNASARLYANGAFETWQFSEIATSPPMKINANGTVHLNSMVEVPIESVIIDADTDLIERTTNLPNPSSANGVTICGWVYRTATDTTFTNLCEIEKNSATSRSIYLQFTASNALFKVGYFSSGGGSVTANFASVPTMNTWVFFAMTAVYGTGTLKGYWWDGATPVTAATNLPDTGAWTPEYMHLLTNSIVPAAAMRGRVCQVRTWDRVLSEAELETEKASAHPVSLDRLNSAFTDDPTVDVGPYNRPWTTVGLTVSQTNPFLPVNKGVLQANGTFLTPKFIEA